jgi:hypothetical protein
MNPLRNSFGVYYGKKCGDDEKNEDQSEVKDNPVDKMSDEDDKKDNPDNNRDDEGEKKDVIYPKTEGSHVAISE